MACGRNLARLSHAHGQRADRVAPELRLLLNIGDRLGRLLAADNQRDGVLLAVYQQQLGRMRIDCAGNAQDRCDSQRGALILFAQP
jgi:hypothetical protein